MNIPDAELESLAEKATPGPWTWDGYRMSAQPNLKKRVYNPTVISVEDGVTYSEYTQGSAELVISEDDAAYIAAANPQRILTLLREKRALVEAVKAAQEMHEKLSEAASTASCDTQDCQSEPWERLVHGLWFDGFMASYRDQFAAALSQAGGAGEG